jgi:hypothetical protein
MTVPNTPTEDEDYLISGEVDDFAIEDENADEAGVGDEDQTAETKVIQEIRTYLKTAIAEHNTFDVIELQNNATPEQKIAAFDMMAIHKGLIMHLRNVQTIINNKVKEN